MPRTPLWRRRVALPTDHGAWAFLLSPLLIGLFAGGRWTTPSVYLVVASLAGFLLRQPITTLVKIVSRRRPRIDLPAALVWSGGYLAIAVLHLVGLYLRGYGFVLVLAIPGVLVFCWYLILVARRDERRQKGVEILGAGVLALSAPAAYWIGVEWMDPRGWTLWILCWIFSTMSIIHVYGRLDQLRRASSELGLLRRPGRRAWAANTLLMVPVVLIGALPSAAPLLPIPFLLQWAESARAAFSSAPPPRATAIGLRQLVVSTLFTVLFIVIWYSRPTF